MIKDKHRRKRKKQIRDAFKLRCVELSNKAKNINLELHWLRSRGLPRSNTEFSLWARNEVGGWIVKGLNIDEMEQYIDRYYNLKAFL